MNSSNNEIVSILHLNDIVISVMKMNWKDKHCTSVNILRPLRISLLELLSKNISQGIIL